MIEILGGNLKNFFDIVDNPPNDAEITYAGERYEVWEVSDELHKKMCDMSEEEFIELAGEDAWWRSSTGSVLGVPDTEFDIREVLGQYAGYAGQNSLKLGQLDELPRGAIIATAELVNVWYIVHHPGTDVDAAKNIPIGAESLTTDKHAPDFGDYLVPTEQEMELGDWTPGRYAWELQNVKILPEPVPMKGKQGLWNWEPGKEAGT